MYLLGYDIGSSSIKAGLIDATTGKQIGVSGYPDQEMGMIAYESGWAEQAPEQWWQNLKIATQRLLETTQINPSQISAIGISYQMHGLVLVDEAHEVLRPAIIWCDSRAVAIGNEAFNELGQDHCLAYLLNSPGNFTASKLKWVKEHEPEVYGRVHKLLLPGDYIAMKLTGELKTTVSGLSEGIFWDFAKKKVSQELLDHYGFDSTVIPDIVSATESQGKVSAVAAEFLGLSADIPVTYRAGDQPNNALSLNVLEPGEVAATGGTSGVVYGIVDKPTFDRQSRVNGFAHVNYTEDKERIGILLCINGAGSQYSWLRNQVAGEGLSYTDMEQMAASITVGSEGLCVLPFGNGAERIFNNRNIGAHVLGLEFNRHHQAHLCRATLEGIAFSFVYGVNILKEMGMHVEVMKVGNDNLFQSAVFSETIATLLDCRIEVVETTGAYGAARAAGVGIGLYSSLKEAMKDVAPTASYLPKSEKAPYQKAYSSWSDHLNAVLAQNPA